MANKKIIKIVALATMGVGCLTNVSNISAKKCPNAVNATDTPTVIKYDFVSIEGWDAPTSIGASTKEYVSNVYHDSSKNSYHIKFVNRNSETGLTSNKTSTLVSGATYDISYWVKSKNSTQKGTIQLGLINNNDSTKIYRFKTLTLNDSSTLSSWVEVKNRFTVPSDLSVIRPTFYLSSVDCEIYIDDLCFTPIEHTDILANHTSFSADDEGNYGIFKSTNSLYETKILELEEYNYYSIKLNMPSSSNATIKFVDYRGIVTDTFSKNLSSGQNEISFKSPSCTYALLDTSVIPNSYVLSKIGSNNVVKSDFSSEKTYSGTPFAVNQLEGAKHGFGYYISKDNCVNTQYKNFYYTGLFEGSPIMFEPNKHFEFEYYIKVLNPDSGFSFGNNLLLRPQPQYTNEDVYNVGLLDTYIDDKKVTSSGGALTGIYDGKWHKITKTINPTNKRYIQFYWDVKSAGKGADVYVDEFKVTWYYSNYNLASMDYLGEELDLYEYENYEFVKKPTETVSKIEDSKLYIDGEITSPIIYLEPNHYHYMKNESITRMAKSHLDLYSTYFGGLNYMWKKEKGVEYIDYEEFDKSIYDLLSNGPDVRIMVNFGMFAPDWWALENPDEISLIYKNETETIKASNNFSPDVANGVSFSSKKYIEEASEVLRQIYAHMKEQDYYNSIFALKISAGRTYEWMNYGMGTDFPNELGDYSPCSLSAFKDYLKDKYGTIANLNSAWSSSYANFNAVEAPTYSERRTNSTAGDSYYKNQKMVDFNLFVSDASSEMLLSFAKLMKELSNNKKIVGAYNGYVWLGGSYSMVGTAHSTYDKVLTSPYIDFIASPLSYGERVLGQTSAFMTLNESVRANGKLYFLENDNRTYMAFKNNLGNDESDSLNTALGVAFNMDETIKYQKSDFANELINGTGMWYYDMSGNWFDNDQYYQMLDLEKQEMDVANLKDINFVNDVAIFVDETTNAYTIANANSYVDQTLSYAYPFLRKELSRIGAGYDVYSMSTLKQGKVPNHKINIFTGVYNCDDEDREAINTLKKNGNVLMFCGPIGYGNNNNWNVSNISNLVGMTIASIDKSYGMRVKTSYSGIKEVSFGSGGTAVNYSTRINDSSVTKLGILSTKQYAGSYYTGLGMKDMGTWTSVYSSATNIAAEVVRFFMERTGAHLYTNEAADTIYSNSNYVGITVTNSGNKTIKLPSSAIVYDVFAGRYVSNKPVSEFTTYIDNLDTKIFRLEDSTATVTVDFGNGSITSEYSFGDTITLTAEEKPYYDFLGFYSGDTLISSSNEYVYTVNGNDNIEAKYEPKQYTITFKDGSSVVKTYTYSIENFTNVVAPTLQNKEHFSYSWENYTLFSSENIVVNALWQEDAKYTVSFKVGESISKTITLYEGETITKDLLPDNPSGEGEFLGWKLNGEDFDFATPITCNLTLEASFSTVTNYTLTFKVEGVVIKTETVESGNEFNLSSITNPTKDGYLFEGWYSNGAKVSGNVVVNGNMTFVARFKKSDIEHIINIGCGGSAITAASLISILSLVGLTVISLKKKKEI